MQYLWLSIKRLDQPARLHVQHIYLFIFNDFYQTNYLNIYPTDLCQNFSVGLKLVFLIH